MDLSFKYHQCVFFLGFPRPLMKIGMWVVSVVPFFAKFFFLDSAGSMMPPPHSASQFGVLLWGRVHPWAARCSSPTRFSSHFDASLVRGWIAIRPFPFDRILLLSSSRAVR